jgi:hypothetical protein
MLARCVPLLADPDRMRGIGHAALDVLRAEPRADQTLLPGVGYHPRHAQRAWRDIVDLLAECVPITQ